MKKSGFDIAEIEKTMTETIEGMRPPPHIRNECDLGFRLTKQSVKVYEVRPFWKNPDERIESPIAKATFTKELGIWKVYWYRASGRWDRFEPHPEARSIEEFLSVVKKDEFCCFFG